VEFLQAVKAKCNRCRRVDITFLEGIGQRVLIVLTQVCWLRHANPAKVLSLEPERPATHSHGVCLDECLGYPGKQQPAKYLEIPRVGNDIVQGGLFTSRTCYVKFILTVGAPA